ncbi:hypothetical protein [Brachyspira sp.]|uniref:hypothetical protein n=1 Tax=Brachyspira sp. TaxID=1977261 RepID=UPI003D7C8D1E
MYKLDIDAKRLKFGFEDVVKACEIASKNTLNTVAFLSRKNAIANINRNFTIRNNFTQRQIQVERVKDNVPLGLMWSSVGATEKADYMRLQEEGGTKEGKNGNILMAQTAARGGSDKNLVAKSMYYKKIKKNIINFSQRKGSRKASLIATAYAAYKNNKFIRYKENIYQVTGFTKAGNKASFTKKHIYNVSQKTAHIDENKWLEPAIQKPVADFQNIFNSNINKMLRSKHTI